MRDCPFAEKKRDGKILDCIDLSTKKWIISSFTVSIFTLLGIIYSIQAKADRVIAIESKVDFIYTFLIEHNGK